MRLVILALISMSISACTTFAEQAEARRVQRQNTYFKDTSAGQMTREMEDRVGKKKLKEWDRHVSDDVITVEILGQ